MEVSAMTWIAAGVAVLVTAVIWALLFRRSREITLTGSESPDQKPEWMRALLRFPFLLSRETPPPETMAATQADDEGVSLYDYDAGEHLAAPFAEQAEDILRARLKADPALAAMEIDLGTTPDGGLEIWVDGECYTDINHLPDERVRQAFRRAIEEWEQTRG